MAIFSYNWLMIHVKTGKLKNELSAFLAEVRKGHEILVLDRNTPIAKIVPFTEAADDFVVRKPRPHALPLQRIRGVKLGRRVGALKALYSLRQE